MPLRSYRRFVLPCALALILSACSAGRTGSSAVKASARQPDSPPSSVTGSSSGPESARGLRTVSAESATTTGDSPASGLVPSPRSESLTERTAAEIRGRYEVARVGNDTLVVRRTDITVPEPSLYEQSIALARIRSRLANNGSGAPAAKMRDGTAQITLGPAISPDLAADTITAILAIQGVQSVRAVF